MFYCFLFIGEEKYDAQHPTIAASLATRSSSAGFCVETSGRLWPTRIPSSNQASIGWRPLRNRGKVPDTFSIHTGDVPSSTNRDCGCHWKATAASMPDYQQDWSTVCGDYALFFLRLFAQTPGEPRFERLDKYLDEDDHWNNDNFVKVHVHSRYPCILNVEKHRPIGGLSSSGTVAEVLGRQWRCRRQAGGREPRRRRRLTRPEPTM